MFWFGAAVALCYVPGWTGAYIATQWPLLSIVLPACALLACLQHVDLLPFKVPRPGPITVFHVLGLLFAAYACCRLPYSPTPYASVFGLWLIVIMCLCVWFGTTATDMRELYAGLATGAAVSSLLAVLQDFGVAKSLMTSQYPAGLYVNSVQQGTVLALIAVALVSERMWWWLAPIVPGLLLSHSRGALLALAIGILGCFTRRLWVFGLVGAAGALFLLEPFSGSDAERMLIWHSAWDNLTWLGWGPGVFYNIILPKGGTGDLFYPEYAHNDALQLAFEYGIVAAIPFAIFAYALSRTDAKEWPVILAFVTAGCYSMPLFMPVASFLALVCVGRILRVHGVDWHNGGGWRQHIVPLWRKCLEMRGPRVPVASRHSAEG